MAVQKGVALGVVCLPPLSLFPYLEIVGNLALEALLLVPLGTELAALHRLLNRKVEVDHAVRRGKAAVGSAAPLHVEAGLGAGEGHARVPVCLGPSRVRESGERGEAGEVEGAAAAW